MTRVSDGIRIFSTVDAGIDGTRLFPWYTGILGCVLTVNRDILDNLNAMPVYRNERYTGGNSTGYASEIWLNLFRMV